MEELDKLKNDWKMRENNFPKFSEQDIYRMLHKKSSSIVKWILIISILEFAFFMMLSFVFNDNKSATTIEAYMPSYLNIVISIISYGIIIYFIYQFYNNYRKIASTDSTKKLMQNILHTRKTVSYYIITNITFLIVYSLILFIIMFNNDPVLLDTMHKSEEVGHGTLAYVLCQMKCYLRRIKILPIFPLQTKHYEKLEKSFIQKLYDCFCCSFYVMF